MNVLQSTGQQYNTLVLTLQANAHPYVLGLKMAGEHTDRFATRVEQRSQKIAAATRGAANQLSSDFNNALAKNEQGLQDVGRSALVAGGLVAAGFGAAVVATMRFDKEMSALRGVIGDLTDNEFTRLRDVVIEAGSATVYSASEAAKGATELARAGVSAADIMNGGLVGALNLAAAGQIDLAEASEIASNAMVMFKLGGRDVTHVADLLAAAANEAVGGVRDMGFAFKQSGLVASQLGISIEETVGTLAMFASNALIGSDAGTSFRTMLMRLVPQSNEARQVMTQLGIEFFDQQGKFIGVAGAARELQDSLKNLSQEQRLAALNTIFGADAIRAATVLYESGAIGVTEWTNKVNQSGAAAKLADTNMDNLAGDLERLKGALETALIRTGDQSNGVLREMVQTTEMLVEGYAQLPGPLQGATSAFAAISGATLLAVGAAIEIIPKYRAMQQVLSDMGTTGQFFARNLGNLMKGLLGVSAVMAGALIIYSIYNQRKAEAKELTDRFTEAILNERKGQEGATAAELSREIVTRKLSDSINTLKVSQGDYNLAVQGNVDAQDRLATSIEEAFPLARHSAESHKALAEALGGSQESLEKFLSVNVDFIEQNPQARKALVDLAKAAQELGPRFTEAQKAADDQKKALDDAGKAARDLAIQQGATGGAAEQLAQSVTGQADELSKLAVELDLTRDQLVQFGQGSEDTAKRVGEAMKQSLEQTQKSFAGFGDIIAKFGSEQDVSAQQIRDFYTTAVRDSDKFISDIRRATERGLDPQFIARLLQAGPEQAAPVLETILADSSGRMIDLVNQSEEKLREINAMAVRYARITNMAVNASTDEMAAKAGTAMEIVRLKYEMGGQASADAIANKLRIGAEEVLRISQDYGLGIAQAANPTLAALNQPQVPYTVSNGPGRKPTVLFAEGGILPSQATIAPGQTLVQWAEPETGGEAFIPMAQSKAGKSIPVLQTVAQNFGLQVVDPRTGGSPHAFASGGVLDKLRRVQRPADLGTGAVNDIADGTMLRLYEGAQELLKRAMASMSAHVVGGGWQAITAALSAAGVPYTVTSSLRPNDLDSLHSTGKAVDLVSSNMMQIFRALEGAAGPGGALQELFYDPAGYSFDLGRRIRPIGGHSDHVHAATYDKGGKLRPGWTVAYNGTGRTEHVLTSKQFEQLVAMASNKGGSTIENLNVYEASPKTTVREINRRFGK